MELEFIIQNWHLFPALVVIVLLLSFDSARRRFGGVKQVTASDLPRLINHEDAVVIDVRESAEYRKGHIPGAVNVPLSPARRRQCEARTLPQVRRAGGRRLPERHPRRPRRERASKARVREGLHPVRRDGGLDQGKPARGKVTA
ncbi:MAG: rhodanese-like domain-containing protein [Gammaproteobacteria bacterium]|nr:rhodanese-like domain-containing protein [Gammaproteobacteria bacterium]